MFIYLFGVIRHTKNTSHLQLLLASWWEGNGQCPGETNNYPQLAKAFRVRPQRRPAWHEHKAIALARDFWVQLFSHAQRPSSRECFLYPVSFHFWTIKTFNCGTKGSHLRERVYQYIRKHLHFHLREKCVQMTKWILFTAKKQKLCIMKKEIASLMFVFFCEGLDV